MKSPKLRKFARWLLRVLVVFLALDLLLLGGWLWKGPDLLSPLVPRALAYFLPNIHAAMRFDSAGIDRYGVVTLRGAELKVQGAQPMQVRIPVLRASLSFASLRYLEPVFARVQADSLQIVLSPDSMANDPWNWVDTALQGLHELPDLKAFQGARIGVRAGSCVRGGDTLVRLERLDMAMRRSGWLSEWSALASGSAAYSGDRVEFDSLYAMVRKPSHRRFMADTLGSARLRVWPDAQRAELRGRNELLDWVGRVRDYAFLTHVRGARIAIGKVEVSSKGVMDFTFANVHAAGDSVWKARFSGRGWLRNEMLRLDSARVAVQVPKETGSIRVIHVAADSLFLQDRSRAGAFGNRAEISASLYALGSHAAVRLLGQGQADLGVVDYQFGNGNFLKARQVVWRQDSLPWRLRTGRVSARFQGEGLDVDSLFASVACRRDAANCLVRTLETDTLRVMLDQRRMQDGPAAMLKEIASLRSDPIWKILRGGKLRTPVVDVVAAQEFRWRFSENQWTIDSVPAGPRVRLEYGQWKAIDRLWASGWLVRRAQTLSKGYFNAKNLGALADTLDFGKGSLGIVYNSLDSRLDWELGSNRQTLADTRLALVLDTVKRSVSGELACRNASVTQLFPLLFTDAFAQGARVGGALSGKIDLSVKLADVDNLGAFKGAGELVLANAYFSGLDLQKQSLVKGRAPLFAERVPFTEIRLEKTSIDPQGLRSARIIAKGPLIGFTGTFATKYNAAFNLNSQAVIPAAAAQKLPTLTRNGLEPGPGGSRKMPLVISGTPTRQELANQEKVIGSAVLNNLRKGFGLFEN